MPISRKTRCAQSKKEAYPDKAVRAPGDEKAGGHARSGPNAKEEGSLLRKEESKENALPGREAEADEYGVDGPAEGLDGVTISRRKALGIFGAGVLGATGLLSVFSDPAEARKRRRRRRKRAQATPSTVTFSPTLGLTQPVTVKNTGTDPITITPNFSGPDASDFSLVSTDPIRIRPGKTTVLPITFAPSVGTGTERAVLEIVEENGTILDTVDLIGELI
jgi:hypothetical protein